MSVWSVFKALTVILIAIGVLLLILGYILTLPVPTTIFGFVWIVFVLTTGFSLTIGSVVWLLFKTDYIVGDLYQ